MSGSFIRLQLTDSSGSIELVAFNQLAELDAIKRMNMNKIYMISYADVKFMNLGCQKWPAKNGSAYELHVALETEIITIDEPLSEYVLKSDEGLSPLILQHPTPKLKPNHHSKYENYVNLQLLEHYKPESLINVLGLIIQVDTHVRKLPNKDNLSLLNFKITDTSSESVSVAVWGAQADNFSFEIGDIVDISKCKLTNFGGRSLSLVWGSSIEKIDTGLNTTQEVAHLLEFSANFNLKRKYSGELDLNDLNKFVKF